MNCKQKGVSIKAKHKNQDDERQSRGNTHYSTVNQRLYVWEEEAKTRPLINFMSNALNNGRLCSKRYLFSQMSLNMTRGEISAYIITSVHTVLFHSAPFHPSNSH